MFEVVQHAYQCIVPLPRAWVMAWINIEMFEYY